MLSPEDGRLLDKPLLFIDDEADYASVNTLSEQQANEERKVTKTNQLIRDILGLFKRNTYIGYTATPFANIFIDPENDNDMLSHNLYPKDFMVKVPTPLAYHGQDFFFGDHSGVPGHVSPLININITRVMSNNSTWFILIYNSLDFLNDIKPTYSIHSIIWKIQ